MKTTGLNILLLLAIAFSGTVLAELYRGLDEKGNVIYSDTPFESAEKYTPPPISVVETPKVEKTGEEDVQPGPEQESEEFRYLHFDITEPAYNQTLANPVYVAVSIRLKPALNTEEKHSIWLLLDGSPVIRNSRQTRFRLDEVVRGAHQLQAQVRDSSGKIVLRTRPVVFFVQRSSAR